jgi:SAM-dependent methyltransferase
MNQADLDQSALWNGAGARGWVEAQEILDRLFQPIGEMLLASIRPGNSVLDVGCGTGGLAVGAARRAVPGGACTGVDIAQSMIEAARVRSEREGTPVQFICGDAQTCAFRPASFDTIISRFGVMFFEDSVRAFANLRSGATRGAQIKFVSWRSIEENAFVTAAERATESLLHLPERRNDEPGQFGLASANRVSSVLEQSGWTDVDIRPLDVLCRLTDAEWLRYVTLIGPVGRYLQEADATTRAQVVELVKPAFDIYRSDNGVRFQAACWTVTART